MRKLIRSLRTVDKEDTEKLVNVAAAIAIGTVCLAALVLVVTMLVDVIKS